MTATDIATVTPHYEASMIDALCNQGHMPYREIGPRAVAHVMHRAGIAYTPDDVRWLVSQIETLRPFPDVIAALHTLRTRSHLGGTAGRADPAGDE